MKTFSAKKDREIKFLLGTRSPINDIIKAGYSASSLRGAGYSASDVLGAGYSASDVLGAGYSEEDLKEWNELPVIENFYTNLLADIKAKKIKYQQSTFGDIEKYDPEINICDSAMCIAGHWVYAAGKIGYETKKKYGWHTTATLLHLKSYPLEPVFDYNITEQSWGMAYIETMAEREKAIKKTK